MFHNLDADAISEVYIQIPPLRQPKDSGNAKMLVACLRVVSLRCQFFSDIFYKVTAPPARVNLWVGGVVAGSCWIVLKTAVNVTRFYAARLAARYLFFQLTSRLRVVLPRNFLTLT